jgi:hypothetical protein
MPKLFLKPLINFSFNEVFMPKTPCEYEYQVMRPIFAAENIYPSIYPFTYPLSISCSGCLALAVLSWLSCPLRPVLAVLPDFPVLVVLSCYPVLTVLS